MARMGRNANDVIRQALDAWASYHRDKIFAKRLEGQNPLDYLINKIEQLVQS